MPRTLDYVVNARLPTEKAHGLQVMRQCEAFAQAGASVRLYYARRFQSREMERVRARDPFAYYDCAAFPARALPTFDLQLPLEPYVTTSVRRLLFLLQSASFAAWSLAHATTDDDRLIYTRDPYYAAALAGLGCGSRTVFEAHRAPDRVLLRARALPRLAGVVAITQGLRDLWEGAGVRAERLHVAPDGVRLEDYAMLPAPEAARAELGLSGSRPLTVYTGHLFGWKGVDTLVAAAALVPEVDVLLVGGLERDQEELVRRTHPTANVHLRRHVPPGEVPRFLAAADVLVLPNSGRSPEGRVYTSPMKLFEYMAARRPIVASDLPSLREVLDPEETAVMPTADDPGALATALRRVCADAELRSRLARRARTRVESLTWAERARGILRFLNRL